MGLSPQCCIQSFVEIGLLVQKKIFQQMDRRPSWSCAMCHVKYFHNWNYELLKSETHIFKTPDSCDFWLKHEFYPFFLKIFIFLPGKTWKTDLKNCFRFYNWLLIEDFIICIGWWKIFDFRKHSFKICNKKISELIQIRERTFKWKKKCFVFVCFLEKKKHL